MTSEPSDIRDAPPPPPPAAPPAPAAEQRTVTSPEEAAGVYEQIDDYRLIQVIGEGGMGIIYKAEQRGALRRVVALKVIKLGMDTRAVIARFEAERQALAMMNHPNIARVYDAGSTALGRPYFVMEYVPGETITQYCDRRQLTIRQRMMLFEKVCDAVQHAHTKGIIHRDLKATNVLVTEVDGQPVAKVIDFGVAKATSQRLTDQTLFTEMGRLVGTPAYMSPEQASGGADIDTRSDVYSLGVLLYELLTGFLPFDPSRLRGVANSEVQRILREDDPPRPSTLYNRTTETSRTGAMCRAATVDELAATLRHELEWIPLRAMRKERSERYETAAQLRKDIQNYLAGDPLIAAPDSRAYRLKKLVRRHRGPFAAAAAVLLALLLGLAGTTWQALKASEAEALASGKAAEALASQELAQANQAKAERHLARVNASLEFVEEIFWGIHPEVGQGRPVTLLEAVDRAERLMAEGLPDPAARARYQHLLGSLYDHLGDHRRAGPLLEEGVKQARDLYVAAEFAGTLRENEYESVTNLVAGLVRQSHYFGNQGDLGRQMSCAREAYGCSAAHLPEGDIWRARAAATLALALQSTDQPGKTRPLLEEALAAMRQHPERFNGQERATLLNNLGQLLSSEKQLEKAAEAYDEAAWVCEESDQVETLVYANVRLNQGILAYKRRKWDEALACLEDATRLRDILLPGRSHLDKADEYLLYAGLLTRAGDHDSAAEIYRKRYELLQQKSPANYTGLCDAARLYATALLRAGRDSEARRFAQESLHWLGLLAPAPDDPAMARRGPKARMIIGETLARSESGREGIRILREVVSELEQADEQHPRRGEGGPEDEELLISRSSVAMAQSALAGAILRASEQDSSQSPGSVGMEEARQLLTEAEQTFRALRSNPNMDVEVEWRQTVDRLVRFFQARNDSAQAEQWRQALDGE